MKDIPDTKFIEISKETPTFTIMTYNTLAKSYTFPSEFPKTSPYQLPFEVRFPRIIKEIQSYPADIICILFCYRRPSRN